MCAKINFFDTPHKMLSTAQDSRQHRQGERERERGGCLIDRCSMPQMRHMAMSSSTWQLSFSLSLFLSHSFCLLHCRKSSSVSSFFWPFPFFIHSLRIIYYLFGSLNASALLLAIFKSHFRCLLRCSTLHCIALLCSVLFCFVFFCFAR